MKNDFNLISPTEETSQQTFKLKVDDSTYELTIIQSCDSLSFLIKNNLPLKKYEGTFNFDDLKKMHFFRDSDNTSMMICDISDSINDNNVTLEVEDKQIVICISYTIKKVKKIDKLALNKIESLDQNSNLEELYNIIKNHEERIKVLENEVKMNNNNDNEKSSAKIDDLKEKLSQYQLDFQSKLTILDNDYNTEIESIKNTHNKQMMK